jgi:hypothetical protein
LHDAVGVGASQAVHRHDPVLPADIAGHRVTPRWASIAAEGTVSEMLLGRLRECALVGNAVNGGVLGRGFAFHG